MAFTKRRFTHGHASPAVFAAAIALGVGLIIGLEIDHFRNPEPSAQSVADFLDRPLPVPQGAKLLDYRPRYYGANKGQITWEATVLLDVTGMSSQDVAAIPGRYAAVYRKQFNVRSLSSGDYPGVIKIRPGDFDDCSRVGTFHRVSKYGGGRFDLALDFDVQDFDPDNPAGQNGYPSHVVSSFDSPVQGQRVMFIRITFHARGLSGTSNVKWAH